MILLTAVELADLRLLLKQSLSNSDGRDLFVALYSSWCHSPMATVSLCLLAQVLPLLKSSNCDFSHFGLPLESANECECGKYCFVLTDFSSNKHMIFNIFSLCSICNRLISMLVQLFNPWEKLTSMSTCLYKSINWSDFSKHQFSPICVCK